MTIMQEVDGGVFEHSQPAIWREAVPDKAADFPGLDCQAKGVKMQRGDVENMQMHHLLDTVTMNPMLKRSAFGASLTTGAKVTHRSVSPECVAHA